MYCTTDKHRVLRLAQRYLALVSGLLMLVLLLTACGGAAPEPENTPAETPGEPAETPTEPATTQPTEQPYPYPSPVRPTAVPYPEPERPTSAGAYPTPDTGGAENSQTVQARARAALAQHLGVEPDTLTLSSSEEREWADTSLGCPAPDTMYLQVITPGYLLLFTAGDDQEYPVHTDESGDIMVLCEEEEPTILDTAASDGSPTAAVVVSTPVMGDVPLDIVEVARQALAGHLEIVPDMLRLDSGLAQTWTSSALGCIDPERPVTDVVMSGYLLVFNDEAGASYAVHTTVDASPLILCQDNQQIVLEAGP